MSLRSLHGKPGHLVRRSQQIAVAVFMEECAAHDITPIQYAVLSVLAARPGIDQSTLAGLAALDRATIGDVVVRLARRRLLSRMPDTRDRRSRVLTLTPRGARLLAAAEAAVRRAQRRILAPLAARERKTLLALLAKLVDIGDERRLTRGR
ncbi:MAG: MarR family transcriptional regulator [Alphaproteobacteria bacterium]|nr:MarR family transcriptional regulator [Alphaproteobacteria bacterium]MCW5742220.1 MarR family transcriptional regulator [Alphaproteobacteria bacterium]